MKDQFEQCFDEFLSSKEYDTAEEALFSIVRAAFLAGWKAAGASIADGIAQAEDR